MALITWSDKFSVKVTDIDNQHKVLVELINKLDAATKAETSKINLEAIYTELTNYTVFHFNHEEALMRKAGFPDFDNHILSHKAFVSKVVEFKAKFNNGGNEVLAEAISFLTNWLVNHIQGVDAKYTPYMHDQGII